MHPWPARAASLERPYAPQERSLLPGASRPRSSRLPRLISFLRKKPPQRPPSRSTSSSRCPQVVRLPKESGREPQRQACVQVLGCAPPSQRRLRALLRSTRKPRRAAAALPRRPSGPGGRSRDLSHQSTGATQACLSRLQGARGQPQTSSGHRARPLQSAQPKSASAACPVVPLAEASATGLTGLSPASSQHHFAVQSRTSSPPERREPKHLRRLRTFRPRHQALCHSPVDDLPMCPGTHGAPATNFRLDLAWEGPRQRLPPL